MRRIFHGLYNISGIPGSLAKAEREHGRASQSVCYPTSFGFHTDIVLAPIGGLAHLKAYIPEFDVFNFHFGYGFFEQSLEDLMLLKRLGKTVNTFFHGCDIRDSKQVIEKYEFSACKACWPVACNANRKQMREWARDHADHVFVSTPDLVEFIPGAIWLPQAAPVAVMRDNALIHEQPGRDDVIRIAHAPSAPALKGTDFVKSAVEQLRAEGLNVELVLLTGMSHDRVLKAIAESDLVIDQLLIGAYGVVAIEAMALGKPTICYIRDDLRALYPDELPIISATIRNLRDVIVEVVERRQEWRAIGEAGYSYARTYHEQAQVARRLSSCY